MRHARPAKTRPLGRPFPKRRLALILILLLAALLRFWGIGRKALWLDEIMSVQKASTSFGDMMAQIKAHDAHPPLFQTVEWLWLRLGSGDGFARIPMTVAGIIAVWLSYLVAGRLLGRTAGWITALFMTVSYFHIYYSQEARLHALVLTLFLGQTYLLLRILHQRGKARWGWWAAYGILGLASLYTYAMCILTIGALGLAYLLVTWKRRRCQFRRFIVVHLLIALLFLPWVPVLRATTARVSASVQTLGDDKGRPTPKQIAQGAASWALGPINWQTTTKLPPLGALLGLFLLLPACAGLMMRRTRRPARILALLFFVPLVGFVLMPMPRVHTYDPKHLIFLQPLFIMALAGFRRPTTKGPIHAVKPAIYIAAVLAALNVWMLSGYYGKDVQKENWPAIVRDIRPRFRQGDVIVFSPEVMGFAFSHYLESDEDRALVRQMAQLGARLNPELIARAKLNNPAASVPPLPKGIRRVWVVQCKGHMGAPSSAVYAGLKEYGFEYVELDLYPGTLGHVKWALFARGGPAAKKGVVQ